MFSANDLSQNFNKIRVNERIVISILVLCLLAFQILDYVEDRALGANPQQLLEDASGVIFPIVLLLYLWRFTPFALSRKSRVLEQDQMKSHKDLAHWKRIGAIHIKGLGETINQQFNLWQLTKAEKDIALFLLKGLSLREISQLRKVSERTVRQQAITVYNKAGLQGRAELSAFFLEDLLLPVDG